jgi:hypothetical protein
MGRCTVRAARLLPTYNITSQSSILNWGGEMKPCTCCVRHLQRRWCTLAPKRRGPSPPGVQKAIPPTVSVFVSPSSILGKLSGSCKEKHTAHEARAHSSVALSRQGALPERGPQPFLESTNEVTTPHTSPLKGISHATLISHDERHGGMTYPHCSLDEPSNGSNLVGIPRGAAPSQLADRLR